MYKQHELHILSCILAFSIGVSYTCWSNNIVGVFDPGQDTPNDIILNLIAPLCNDPW